ncbi:MAG: nucleotidyl transferase AbiEii/AbiGii toxin family protein [Bacteroidales bacterium]|nr:nucleotidyl transferase AbiEii/AbiGii toxin family protein [Bacteroidales bacterium]
MMNFYQIPDEDKLLIYKGTVRGLNMDIPEDAIEKDWWAVQTLRLVFETKAGKHMVFKGGTSLSKGWNLIDRFSEDVDLGLSWGFLGFPEDISRNQVKTKLRKASNHYLSNDFKTDLQQAFEKNGIKNAEVFKLEKGDPDQDPIEFEIRYPRITENEGALTPTVRLEIGIRSMREPHTKREIRSFVGEVFQGESFADAPINIPCVNPERTFLEKLFLLHEEFKRPERKIRFERMSRHLYDIDKISRTLFYEKAISNGNLYRSIVKHREKFSRMGGVNYESHYPPNLNPIPPAEYMKHYQEDYEKMQLGMIYDSASLPFEELIENIRRIAAEINEKIF